MFTRSLEDKAHQHIYASSLFGQDHRAECINVPDVLPDLLARPSCTASPPRQPAPTGTQSRSGLSRTRSPRPADGLRGPPDHFPDPDP